jgi:outer membrane protein
MKKNFGCIVMTALVSVVFSVSAIAAGGSPKIGYFDIQAAISQSETGKRVMEELKKEGEKLGAALEEKERQLMKSKDEYDKKKDVMDEKARSRKEKELTDMLNDFQKLRSESNTKFSDQRSAAMEPLGRKIKEVVSKVGREEKFDFIFEKAALHYTGTDTHDLTKKISAELDRSSVR